ncbi:MAG: ATP-dependent DNA ligase, partial [Myxococcales bacterium]
MERFAALYEALDATTSTLEKVRAMEAYFRSAPPEDAAWGLYFLTGRKLRRLVGGGALRTWAAALTGLPAWLVEESHTSVGDVAETVALLLDTAGIGGTAEATTSLTTWARDRLPRLGQLDETERQALMVSWWRELPTRQVFLLNKLVTGSLRVGVSATLVARALAGVAGLPVAVVTHRLMGDWTPSETLLPTLIAPGETAAEVARPYPFYLASPIDGDPAQGVIGALDAFVAEWKWDGIRAQIVRRRGETFVWSRGEELMTDRFPELLVAATALPDGTVLDGEILAWQGDRPMPFAVLQTRIGRKKVSARELTAAPISFLAYDLLERDGVDWRERPLHERQAELARLVEAVPSPRIARSEPAVAGLRVDEHGVDRVRVELPLPPVAALAADAVGRLAPLE